MTFEVSGVTRPILSVGELARKGFSADFGPTAGTIRGPNGMAFPLRFWRGAYYLEFVQEAGGASDAAKAVLAATTGEDQAEESDCDRGLEIYAAAVVPVSAETEAPIDDGAEQPDHDLHKLVAKILIVALSLLPCLSRPETLNENAIASRICRSRRGARRA